MLDRKVHKSTAQNLPISSSFRMSDELLVFIESDYDGSVATRIRQVFVGKYIVIQANANTNDRVPRQVVWLNIEWRIDEMERIAGDSFDVRPDRSPLLVDGAQHVQDGHGNSRRRHDKVCWLGGFVHRET